MIDTGTKEMHDAIRTNVTKLGFKLQDIRILLSGHADFDHVQGHPAMQKATGAKVMAIREDAAALAAGADQSPLEDEGWEPVKVDRILKDGDMVTLGGTTPSLCTRPAQTRSKQLRVIFLRSDATFTCASRIRSRGFFIKSVLYRRLQFPTRAFAGS